MTTKKKAATSPQETPENEEAVTPETSAPESAEVSPPEAVAPEAPKPPEVSPREDPRFEKLVDRKVKSGLPQPLAEKVAEQQIIHDRKLAARK